MPKSGVAIKDSEIIVYGRDRLAGSKCLKKMHFVEKLPKNPSGKILKHELKKCLRDYC